MDATEACVVTGELSAQVLMRELAIQELNEAVVADNDEELVVLSSMTADQFALQIEEVDS